MRIILNVNGVYNTPLGCEKTLAHRKVFPGRIGREGGVGSHVFTFYRKCGTRSTVCKMLARKAGLLPRHEISKGPKKFALFRQILNRLPSG